MPKSILIKGVDEETYRRAKATAALEGLPMGKAVTEALSRWVAEQNASETEREYSRNLEFVRREWKALLEPRKGKAVVVSQGALRGTFDSLEEASTFAKKFRIALTFVVEGLPEGEEIELGPDLGVQQGP